MQKLLRDTNIGKNIQKIRLSKGFTQEQVINGLQLLGSPIIRETYAQIEIGKGNIFVNDLVAMKIFFHVNFEEFFINISPNR